MTDGLRKSHLRKAPQVGLSEVGLPEGNQCILGIFFLLGGGIFFKLSFCLNIVIGNSSHRSSH